MASGRAGEAPPAVIGPGSASDNLPETSGLVILNSSRYFVKSIVSAEIPHQHFKELDQADEQRDRLVPPTMATLVIGAAPR